MAGSINLTKINWVIQGTLLQGGGLPGIVVEEIMFRGMLWMLLKNLNFSEIKIVILQAILFWISHVYAFNNLAFFWINAPMISILLGVIVWRSKSITPSTIAHILINMLLGFVSFRNL
jgi:membrane protease YdiL (CAAX protease family)